MDATRHAGWTKPAVITIPPVNAERERPLCGAIGERHADPKRKEKTASSGKVGGDSARAQVAPPRDRSRDQAISRPQGELTPFE